jgi:predicted anti-sigma-YlaC factor YlaD
MQSDNHKRFQQMIDETLASGVPVEEDHSLREHLQSCASCGEYLDNSRRAIASLSGFSFTSGPADSALREKVCASLSQRAQQLEATPLSGRRWAFACTLAIVLTGAGAFLDMQFGGLAAAWFQLPVLQVQRGLVSFWIVPSLAVALLFPLLPLLSRRRAL